MPGARHPQRAAVPPPPPLRGGLRAAPPLPSPGPGEWEADGAPRGGAARRRRHHDRRGSVPRSGRRGRTCCLRAAPLPARPAPGRRRPRTALGLRERHPPPAPRALTSRRRSRRTRRPVRGRSAPSLPPPPPSPPASRPIGGHRAAAVAAGSAAAARPRPASAPVLLQPAGGRRGEAGVRGAPAGRWRGCGPEVAQELDGRLGPPGPRGGLGWRCGRRGRGRGCLRAAERAPLLSRLGPSLQVAALSGPGQRMVSGAGRHHTQQSGGARAGHRGPGALAQLPATCGGQGGGARSPNLPTSQALGERSLLFPLGDGVRGFFSAISRFLFLPVSVC